jgi:hypothetical protein
MRACIFCSERASSAEDAWPLWLVRRFPSKRGVRVDAQRDGSKLRSWNAPRHGIRIRHICRRCNNGWMSQLENRAKPVVERLLDMPRYVLSSEDRTTLAAWMVKNSMVLEGLRDTSDSFYTDDERREFCTRLTMPQPTTVWIARCTGMSSIWSAASDHSETAQSAPGESHLFVTTMGFGPVALQIATARIPPSIPDAAPVSAAVRPGLWADSTLTLWPDNGEPSVWPPPVDLVGELGVEAFHSRWRG